MLWVFFRQHKVEVKFVVNLAVVGCVFLEEAVDELGSQPATIVPM